ncbi:MAG: hypothetical protein ACK5NK_01995 [Niabella sp.]
MKPTIGGKEKSRASTSRFAVARAKVIRNVFIKQTNDTSYNAPENIRDDSRLDQLHWSITNIQSV